MGCGIIVSLMSVTRTRSSSRNGIGSAPSAIVDPSIDHM
jgi:hypothetical protein